VRRVAVGHPGVRHGQAAVRAQASGLAEPMRAELVGLVESGTITGKAAKDVFEEAFAEGRSPRAIVDAKGLTRISDAGAIEASARRVIEANPNPWLSSKQEFAMAAKASGRSYTQLIGEIVEIAVQRYAPRMAETMV